MRKCSRSRSSDLFTSKPQAPPRVLQAERHRLTNAVREEKLQVRIEEHHGKCVVVLKEGPQEVRLVPGPALEHPRPRVFERVEDVVHVDVDSAPETRQDLKHQVVDVAPDLADMRGVDEENVRVLELFEPN